MLEYFNYRLQFKNPFRIAGQEFTHREGIILVYKEGNIEAYGEAAPLPGFSEESLEDVRTVLTMNHRNLEKDIRSGEGEDSLRLLTQIHSFPSLSFALDTLIHDLAAKSEEKSLSNYLYSTEPANVLCNYTIPMKNEKLAVDAASQAYDNGYKTVKVKVGSDFDKELSILKSIRKGFSDLKIRIDANGAWSEEEAIRNLNKLESTEIEFCEQPVAKNNLSGMANVRNATEIPIAADESVRSKNDAIRIIGEKAADILVIKPMLFGILHDINVTKQLADSHNIELVFTTSLESAIGRTTTAVLANGIGSKKYAHGLATDDFFEKDIALQNPLRNGVFQFTTNFGIGVPVELKLLQEMSV